MKKPRSPTLRTYITDAMYDPRAGIAVSWREYGAPDGCPPHRHNYFEFELLVSGRGRSVVNGCGCNLSRGAAYLIRPSDFHSVELEGGSALINVSFSEAALGGGLLDRITLSGGDLVLPDGARASGFLENTARAMLDEFGQPNPDSRILRSLLECLLSRLLRDCGEPCAKPQPKPSFEAALQYLQLHFHENPSLSDTARAAHYNPSHFSAIFHSRMQVTYSDYLNTLRVNCAKKLLLTTDLRVGELAQQCGFGSQTNLQRVFREKTGLTPLAFRVSGKSAPGLNISSGTGNNHDIMRTKGARAVNNSGKKDKNGRAPTKKGLDTVRLDAPRTDPQGSYTGRPSSPEQTPVQDADDL